MRRIQIVFLLILGLLALPAVAADTVYYIHTDALGSPVAMTDANRNVIERTQYAPYGQVLNRPEHDGPGYTGHEEDSATGLTNMQQRYAWKVIGRMISIDPVGVNPSTGANFNRYAYAGDNPYKFTDPDGRQDCVSADCKDTEVKPTTGCLTSGCNGSSNVSVTVVDESYRKGAGTGSRRAVGGWGVAATGAAGGAAATAAVGTLEQPGTKLLPEIIDANPLAALVTIMTGLLSGDTQQQGRPVVIGESMTERVIPFATSIGAGYYRPIPNLRPDQYLSANREWINGMMDENRRIIDIGADPKRPNYPMPSSIYYRAELEEIQARGYPTVRVDVQ